MKKYSPLYFVCEDNGLFVISYGIHTLRFRFCSLYLQIYGVFVVAYESDVEYKILAGEKVEHKHHQCDNDLYPPYVAARKPEYLRTDNTAYGGNGKTDEREYGELGKALGILSHIAVFVHEEDTHDIVEQYGNDKAQNGGGNVDRHGRGIGRHSRFQFARPNA